MKVEDVTLDEMILCVQREMGLRNGFYPKLVLRNRMTQAEADLEAVRMRAVLHNLLEQRRRQVEPARPLKP